jgi:transposase
MKPPLFTRPFADGELLQLEDALRASDAFRLRRAQYLLASACGLKPGEIAAAYGGCDQQVRNVIHAFNATGLECLTPQSRRPKNTRPLLDETQLARLQHLLHQSPRSFGKNKSVWTQQLLVEVAYEEGLTPERVSDETIRRALSRLSANWKRAKHWISSPDPQYTLKKSGENG